MTELKRLPLFPLNTVLFPGMSLPLHIFEPRYQVMVKRCLKFNEPFGVVLIREGSEVGGGAVPHSIGTSAYITHVQPLDGGRMNIQAVGYQRFQIHQLEEEQPFLVGLVEDYPLDGANEALVETAASHLRLALGQYISTLVAATDVRLSLSELPEEAQALAYLTGMTLPLSAHEKQALLAARDLASLLEAERSLLRRELMLLAHMIGHRQPVSDPDMPFSLS